MSYKVLFSKLAEKEVNDILYIRLIMKFIIFEKWSLNIILSYTL